jgi:CBS-domain-containing membrane protein
VKVRDIMTRPVTTVHTDTPIDEAAALLATHNITSLPVLDDEDKVVGIISEADLIRDRMPQHDGEALAPAHPAHRVWQVMTETVVCLTTAADTADAAELMLSYDVRAVPVVDGGRLEGIVSRRDLLRTLIRDDDLVAAEVRERLDYYAARHGRWGVTVEDGVVTLDGEFDDEAERQVVTVLARTVAGVTDVHTSRRHLVG